MYQFILLIFIYLVGLFYLWLLFPQLKNIDKQLLSPFFGVGFSGISVGFLLMFRIPLSLISFVVSLVTIYFLIHLLIKKFSQQKYFSILSHKGFASNLISIPFFLYIILSFSFVITVYTDASTDSIQFESVGRYVSQGGLINSNVPEVSFLLNGRLLIVGAMHALNRLFHGYNLYALNPIMCSWLLLFLTYILIIFNKNVDRLKRMIVSLFFFITLGLYKHYLNFMISIMNNQLAMVFFTVSIVSLYIYSLNEEKSWVYIGSLAIAFACLTRVDMLLCSLIFFFLLTLIDNISYKTLKFAWYIFIVLLLPWRIFTLYYTPWNTWYVNVTQISLLIGANIILCILSILLHKYNRISLTLFRNIPFIFGSSIILLLIFYMPDKLQLGWDLFIKYILLGHSTWLLLVISLAVSTVSFYYVGHRDVNYYVLFSPTVLYLFMLFLLVAFGGHEMEDHSAKRMVFHTVPLFIFSLFIALMNFMSNKSDLVKRLPSS